MKLSFALLLPLLGVPLLSGCYATYDPHQHPTLPTDAELRYAEPKHVPVRLTESEQEYADYQEKLKHPDPPPVPHGPNGMTWQEWKDQQYNSCYEENIDRINNFKKLQNARHDIKTECKKIGRDMTMSPDPDSRSAHDHLEYDDNGHIIYVEGDKHYIRLNAQYKCPVDMDEFHQDIARNWMNNSPPWVGMKDCNAFTRP